MEKLRQAREQEERNVKEYEINLKKEYERFEKEKKEAERKLLVDMEALRKLKEVPLPSSFTILRFT